MPRINFPFVLIMLLTACVPNTTIIPTPSVTSSPIAQATHTAIVTQTPSPTETTPVEELIPGVNADRELSIVSYDKIENVSDRGVTVNGGFVVDESAVPYNEVHEVTVPDKLGAEIIFDTAFNMYWYHGSTPHKEQPTDQDKGAYRQMMKEVQNGTRSCEEAIVTPYAHNKDSDKVGQELIPIAMFCGEGASIPEGVTKIDKVEIVYGSWYTSGPDGSSFVASEDMPNMTSILDGAGRVSETEIDGNTLRFKIGLIYLTNQKSRQGDVAAQTVWLFKWIRSNNGKLTQLIRHSRGDYNEGKDYTAQGFSVK